MAVIRKLRQWLQNYIFYAVWLLLHITYQLQLEIREYLRFNLKYVKRRLLSCFPLYSQEKEFSNFVESTSKLSKLPKHLAISVIPENKETVLSVLLERLWGLGGWRRGGDVDVKKNEDLKYSVEEGINLASLSNVIAWAAAANIPAISLYDYHGVLKSKYKELGLLIQEDIAQNFWAVKQHTNVDKPPIVKFHNVHKSNGYVNGVNGIRPHEALHIFVYSREDGKPAIVNAVKDLCTEKLIKPNNKEDIDEARTDIAAVPPTPSRFVDETTLDSYLNLHRHVDVKNDPDLLLIFGKVKSTLGFLPWHIRLTEIHWLPTLSRVELSDLLSSLTKYSRCQQRFGT